MKKKLYLILITIIAMLIIGCTNNKTKDEFVDTEAIMKEIEEKETSQRTFEDDVTEYKEEFEIKLSWKDVQYDMPNNWIRNF